MPANPQGKWVVSELVSGFILALKGRDIPAQGNALGSDPPIRKALKGRDISVLNVSIPDVPFIVGYTIPL